MLNQHRTIKNSIKKFNKSNPLAGYLISFLGDKKHVKIADLGSGPFSIIGNYLDGVKLEIHLIDNQDFTDFWKKYQVIPFLPIEKANMEKLSYADNFFDIVHCVNALDHTKDALSSVKEMIRICKSEGYIYIDCALDQMSTGHKHYWNVKKDGTFYNLRSSFNLKDFGFEIKFIENNMEDRYNHIIAIYNKKIKL